MIRKTGIVFVLFFILTILTAGCGGGGGSAAPTSTTVNNVQYGGISGIITDPADGKPVSGAIVTLDNGVVSASVAKVSSIRRSINRAPVAATITNAQGYYQFVSVPTGNYNISVVKDGKLGAQISHVVRAGEDTTLAIELTPVITVTGTFTVETSSIQNSNSPDTLVWFLGTSFGSVAKQISSNSSTTSFSFTITGVPANPNVAYTLKYFSEGSVSVSRTVLLVPTQLEVTLTPVVLVPDTTPVILNGMPVALVTSSAASVIVNTSITLNGAASTDPDSDPLTYHWTQTSGQTIAGTQSGSTYIFTPVAPGNYTFLLYVKDDKGGISLPASIYINAYTVANLPPTATASASVDSGTPGSSVDADTAQTISLIGTGTDPENASMTYRWVQTGGPKVTFSDSNTGETLNAQISFVPTLAGNYAFAFIVSDGVFKTAPEFVTVNVTAPVLPTNNIPVVNAGPDQNIANINTLVTLDGTWAPQDTMDVPVITWTQITGSTITLTNPDTLAPEFTPSIPGIYVFQLVVNDGVYNSASDFVSIIVNTTGNQAPVVMTQVTDGTDPLSIVPPSTSITLDGTGSNDPDNQPVNPAQIKWTQLSGAPVTINNDTQLIANTALNAVGTYSFKLEIFDGAIKSESIAFITVNQKPVVVLSPPNQQVIINTVVTIDSTNSYDNDGTTIFTYALTQKSGPYNVTLNGSSVGIFTFQPNQYGTYVFGMVGNDGVETSDEILTTIVVKAPPFDRTKTSVTMSNPGTQDNLTGVAGATGNGIIIKASSDRSFNDVMNVVVSNPDGLFVLDIGDNSSSIINDKFYISFFDSNNVRGGEIFEFINDVTPPASPIINFDTTDGHITSANESSYTIAGKAEPGIQLNAVVGTANNLITVPANGSFTVNVDCSNLVDRTGIKVELIVKDAYNNTHTYFIKEIMKDTVSPIVALQSPGNGDRVKPSPNLKYTITEDVKEVEFRFVDIATPANIHSYFLKNGNGLLAGEHVLNNTPLDTPLTSGESYNLTITATDKAGNVSMAATTNNLTCDGVILPGTSITYPTNGQGISSEKPLLSYTLSEAMSKGQLIINCTGGPIDPACPRVIDIPILTSGIHNNEIIRIKSSLKLGTTYSYIIIFEDMAGNQMSPVMITNLNPMEYSNEIRVLKPADNGKISANPVLSYVLTDTMTAVSFNFTYVSGPVSPDETYTLTGLQLGSGVHENQIFNPSGTFVHNAVYELNIKGLTSEGKPVLMERIMEVTVDAVGPELLTATAIQSVFGSWNGGDQIIFKFNEPMDTTIFGGLNNLPQINANMNDNVTIANDFSPSTPSWSNDRKTLTLTLLANLGAAEKFKAGQPGDAGISAFLPTSVVRDVAGNSDITVGNVELVSTGDVTAPGIEITSPIDGFKIATDPVILYTLTEKLREGTLAIMLVGGLDSIPVRLFTIDPSRLGVGSHSINTYDEGIFSLTPPSVFKIKISGIDGAGNQSNDIVNQLTVDGVIPTPPMMGQYSFRNFAHNVKLEGGSSDGMAGFYLRIYINGVPYTAAFQAPYNIGDTVISGLPTANPGDTIEFSFVTQAGEESDLVNAGVVPAPPTANDVSYLAIDAGPSAAFFTGNSTNNLEIFNTTYYAIFSNNMNEEQDIGTTDGSGIYSPNSDSIQMTDLRPLDQVYYVVNNVDGHFSALSAPDGRLETLAAAGSFGTNGNTAGDLYNLDTITLAFTGNINMSAGIDGGNFAFGTCTDDLGNYNWPIASSFNDVLVAPVSNSAIANIGTTPTISSSAVLNQSTITITFADSGPLFITPTSTVRVDINPYGSNIIRGSNGKHCVLSTIHYLQWANDIGGVPVTGF